MAPPAGATLLADLTRASNWQSENGGNLDQLTEKGPGGELVLRSTLDDTMSAPTYGGTPNERNDLVVPGSAGNVPLGSTRWMIWHERFVKMPNTNLSWQLIGPNEIHGVINPQAPVMPLVEPTTKRRQLIANAGRDTQRYFNLSGAIVPGEWHQYKMGVHYTNDNTGWLEMWRDGVRVMRIAGEPTTLENRAGYWKFGHYRNAAINGTSIYDVSGVRI